MSDRPAHAQADGEHSGRVPQDEAMKVQLLHFDGCPNWRETDHRLRQALDQAGRHDVQVERIRVSTPEEAEATGFLGSPTVRIDGADPFAEPGARVALACRLYRTSTGLAGAPTIEQLLEAVQTAEASGPRPSGWHDRTFIVCQSVLLDTWGTVSE